MEGSCCLFSVAETQASANLHALYLICRFERHRSCGGSLDFEGGVVAERWVQDTAVGREFGGTWGSWQSPHNYADTVVADQLGAFRCN